MDDMGDMGDMDDMDRCKAKFVYNAVNDGWNVRKIKDIFIFTKKHENKKEIMSDDYLKSFLIQNLTGNKPI
jgi:hypothetical protein